MNNQNLTYTNVIAIYVMPITRNGIFV